MSRYTVVWDKDVEYQFIAAWTAGDSQMRATLTEIANWVDENLAEFPEQKGRDRPDLAARILAVPVSNSTARVAVTYQILPDDRKVQVVSLTFQGG